MTSSHCLTHDSLTLGYTLFVINHRSNIGKSFASEPTCTLRPAIEATAANLSHPWLTHLTEVPQLSGGPNVPRKAMGVHLQQRIGGKRLFKSVAFTSYDYDI